MSSRRSGFPLAPFTLALVLGSRAEDAFRLSMIGSGGDMKVFWSNGLVGSITTLAIVLLFWPVIEQAFAGLGAVAAGEDGWLGVTVYSGRQMDVLILDLNASRKALGAVPCFRFCRFDLSSATHTAARRPSTPDGSCSRRTLRRAKKPVREPERFWQRTPRPLT
jgi:hypothetical protein